MNRIELYNRWYDRFHHSWLCLIFPSSYHFLNNLFFVFFFILFQVVNNTFSSSPDHNSSTHHSSFKLSDPATINPAFLFWFLIVNMNPINMTNSALRHFSCVLMEYLNMSSAYNLSLAHPAVFNTFFNIIQSICAQFESSHTWVCSICYARFRFGFEFLLIKYY